MRQAIRFLSDDSLKGRQPGCFGEEVAAAFVASQLEEIGCLPAGEDGTYYQTIKMVGMTCKDATSRLAFRVKDFQITGHFGDDYVHSADPVGETEFSLENLDLLFVGHGVHAVELDWDDFKGEAVAGKVLLVLVNQPQVKPFPEDDMLYYGRWIYKFEEARRKGAAGCLIIHCSEELAGYPWSVTRTGYSGEKVSLEKPEVNPLCLHGWLTRELGSKLAEAAGSSLEDWITQAQRPEFRPFAVGSVSHAAEYSLRRFEGRNVLGWIPGVEQEQRHEVVVIAGHHDHLGEREGEIYNGAVDNCTGVAMMLATARLVQQSELKLKRSVLFMAPTAEECGLLGSHFYASNPLPIDGTKVQPVAAFAFDVGNVWGKTADLAVLGYGKSTLDPILEEAATTQGLRIIPDQQPKMGLFYRSDHWSFVRTGVPGCWFFFGQDFVDKPAGYYEEVIGRYIKQEYHKPADVYKPEWSMEGLLSQVEYTLAVVKLLGMRTDIPKMLDKQVALPEIPVGQSWRIKRPRKAVGFGLRCFDCKIAGCTCFL